MPAQNTLANLFSNLQNAELRNKHECLVIPSSKLIIDTLNTMKENNYVGEFEVIDWYFFDEGFNTKIKEHIKVILIKGLKLRRLVMTASSRHINY